MTTANKPLVSATETKPSRAPRVGQRLLERIGNTPLIRIERLAAEFPNVRFARRRNGSIRAVR